uniref:F-box domain-containing protein n=1 Tax=Picea sitchensis TaxID=3332 RepID=D5AEF6_PICSI|nr:unknown [Picea sitchensis]
MNSMEELPESCISQILSFTTPRDVCRLSAVSHTFRLAGNSDPVWEKMLPVQYRHLLARLDSPLQFSSKRELYFTLCHPNSIDGRTKKFWIEQATGKLCFMLSARDLNITWGDDRRYWHWISQDDSSFKEIAELVAVCWLEVRGQFDCEFLSPGTAYTVSFRLKLHKSPLRIGRIFRRRFIRFFPRTDGWDHKPVKFSVTTPCGDHQEYARYLRNTDTPVGNEGYQMTPFRHVEEGWMEFDAGRFVVPEDGDNSGMIKFCMREWEGGDWKGGLLLGGVKIQPTSLVNERTNANQE